MTAPEPITLPPLPEPGYTFGEPVQFTATQMNTRWADGWKAGYKHGAWADIPLSCRDSHEASLKYVEGYEAGRSRALADASQASEVVAGRMNLDEAMLVGLFTALVAGAYVSSARPTPDFDGAADLVRQTIERVKRF